MVGNRQHNVVVKVMNTNVECRFEPVVCIIAVTARDTHTRYWITVFILLGKNNNDSNNQFLYYSTFPTRRASQSASNMIAPWSPFHSLNHLTSLGIQHVQQICATKLNQPQEPSLPSHLPILALS